MRVFPFACCAAAAGPFVERVSDLSMTLRHVIIGGYNCHFRPFNFPFASSTTQTSTRCWARTERHESSAMLVGGVHYGVVACSDRSRFGVEFSVRVWRPLVLICGS